MEAGARLGRRPSIMFEGKIWYVPRVSYTLNVAPIPRTPINLKDGLVLHHCDNEWCIEPTHLYLGSGVQNVADIINRNRRSPDHNQKLRGRKESDETRAKKAESARKRWAAHRDKNE